MSKHWLLLKMGLRAAVWKATPEPPSTDFATLVFWIVLTVSLGVLDDFIAAAGPARFVVYGVTALVAWVAIILVLTAFFVRPEGRATALGATLAVSVVVEILRIAISLVPADMMPDLPKLSFWTSAYTGYLIFVAYLAWWIGAVLAIFRSVEPERRAGRPLRIAGLWCALVVAWVIFPHQPVFQGRDFDFRYANWWEYVEAILDGRFNEEEPRRPSVPVARVELLQPALLERASAALAPQQPGVTDIYTIGLAGWANQDVFLKELDGALDSVSRVLPTDNRVLRLVNHPDTVLNTPIATRQNFAAAVRSVARLMDRDEDVLLLFMTSHGSRRGVDLQFSVLADARLSPDDVASVLDQEGVKNRILIISACYSGVFAKPLLADDNTIVLTAADENNPSFGCSNERDWTYFGDALFNRGLAAGKDVEHAFHVAKDTIADWETRDNLPRSNPQGHFGPALMKRLAPVYRAAVRAEISVSPADK